MTFGWQGTGKRALEFPDGAPVAPFVGLAPVGRGRLRYNRVLNRFEQSLSGAAYVALGGGGGSDLGYPLCWGAGLTTVLRWMSASADIRGQQLAVDGISATDQIVLASGRITQFSMNTVSADATTVMQIFVDNAAPAAGLVTLSAPGPQLIALASPIDVTVGMVVGVQYVSGAAPGGSTASILIEP